MTSLSILRRLGEGVGGVARIPNLVGVTTAACPELNTVPTGQGATSQICAFPVVGPGEPVISGVGEFLVGVVAGARPNLQFNTVDVLPIGDVQAFVSKDFDLGTCKGPLLGSGACTRLDCHMCAIGV